MLNNSSHTQGFRKTTAQTTTGIMEPLYSEEHLQNIYAHTLSGKGTATGSRPNHFMWNIKFQWTNP